MSPSIAFRIASYISLGVPRLFAEQVVYQEIEAEMDCLREELCARKQERLELLLFLDGEPLYSDKTTLRDLLRYKLENNKCQT